MCRFDEVISLRYSNSIRFVVDMKLNVVSIGHLTSSIFTMWSLVDLTSTLLVVLYMGLVPHIGILNLNTSNPPILSQFVRINEKATTGISNCQMH